MPRISQLPSLTTAANEDELPIVDVSASTTNKITRGDLLKAPLPTDSVTTAAIANAAVTLAKINGGTTAGVLLTDASGNVTGGKVTADKLDSATFDLGVDANGWSVEMKASGKKTYRKLFTGTISTNITANGSTNMINSQALPVGVSSLSGYSLLMTSGMRYSGGFSVNQEASGSTSPQLSTALTVNCWNGLATAAAPGDWSLNVQIDQV